MAARAGVLRRSAIVAFSATDDPAAAREFYRDKLGLPIRSEDPFALVFDAAGTMLRVAIVPKVKPAGYTVLGWDVEDIVDAVKELQKRGVEFQLYPGMPQDALGIWTSPAGARIAWFQDPDGNTLSLTQFA